LDAVLFGGSIMAQAAMSFGRHYATNEVSVIVVAARSMVHK
jgi:hypothetical protein